MTPKMKTILILFVALSLIGCESKQLLHESSVENELYKVSILYPNGQEKTFDMEYYQSRHMPMVAGFIGENLSFYEIDQGIAGRTPDEKVPYVAIGYFYIKNVSEYQKAISQNRETILNDIKKYTNIRPIIQVSEMKYIGFNK
jgi:uncharacterized protein (TIGR02118 family)